MPVNGLVIGNRISLKEKALAGIENELLDLDERSKDFSLRLEATDETDLEALKALEEESNELERAEASLLERKKGLEGELKALREEMQRSQFGRKAVTKAMVADDYDIRSIVRNYKKNGSKDKENANLFRSVLNDYLHTRDTEIFEVLRDSGYTTTDGSVLIPTEILYTPTVEPHTQYDLLNYVQRIPVSTSSGKHPVLKPTTAVLHTVQELKANPALEKPSFYEVEYTVNTYRGEIVISEEAIDDTQVDLIALMRQHLDRIILNTTNKELAPIFKSFNRITAKSLDDLKKIDDIVLDPLYTRRLIMTQSMYHYLNTMKDKHGDYMLQDDITAATGKQLIGMPISITNDTLLGEYNGHLAAFMGDSNAGIGMFDRLSITAKWVDDHVYGQALMVGFRAGFGQLDENAGYYITLAPPELDYNITLSKATAPETIEGVSVNWSVNGNTVTAVFNGLETKHTPSVRVMLGQAVVAQATGHLEIKTTGEQIDVTFGPAGAVGNYTLEARVKDTQDGTTKTVSSQPMKVERKSDAVKADINLDDVTDGIPIVIAKNG